MVSLSFGSVYVDKLAKVDNGIKYLLVCQELFDTTVDAKRMKTKHSKELIDYDYKKARTQKHLG